MPAAPDLQTLLDLAGNIEPALQTVLQAITLDGANLVVRIQRETGDLASERIDVQFVQGQWTGSLDVDNAGRMQRRAWNYQLRFRINSAVSATDPTRHGKIRALVKVAMQDPATFAAGAMPYHVLSTVEEQSETPQVNQADDLEISVLAYTGIVSIRTGSWPAV